MLVLSRKLGERIVIGDRIVVTVVKLDHGQVRLGIEAPRESTALSEEIAPFLPTPPGATGRLRGIPIDRAGSYGQGSG